MSIKPEALERALANRLEPVYLLAGAEQLLVQEARDQVIRAAQQQGFLERHVLQQERGFSWDDLESTAREQSLFASRKIIDLRIPTGKPGIDGGKVLTAYAQEPDPDIVLIVSCGAWDASSRKSKWASQLANAGVLVELWPIKANELPAWINKRIKDAGLKAEREAVRLLAEFVEGNLLAAQQEIDKLKLLDTGAIVTVETIRNAVISNARFDAFRLGECIMQGKAAEGLRVAGGLQRTGVAIQAVAGALYYQLAQMEGVRSAIASGDSENSAFGRFRVFRMHQPLMRQALRRIPPRNLSHSFSSLSQLDKQSKGQAAGDPWQTLEQLVLVLCADRHNTDSTARRQSQA